MTIGGSWGHGWTCRMSGPDIRPILHQMPRGHVWLTGDAQQKQAEGWYARNIQQSGRKGWHAPWIGQSSSSRVEAQSSDDESCNDASVPWPRDCIIASRAWHANNFIMNANDGMNYYLNLTPCVLIHSQRESW